MKNVQPRVAREGGNRETILYGGQFAGIGGGI